METTPLVLACLFVLIVAIVFKRFFKTSPKPFNWPSETVLITGGSQGIGRCLTELIRTRGARHIMILDVVEPTFKLPTNAEFIKCDISDRESIKQLKDKLGNKRPTVLINNAGVWNRGKRIGELSDQEIDRVIGVNLMGPIWLIREFLPPMLAARHGRIVNVSSVLGIGGVSHMTDYCASKFGLFGMNEALRMELKKDGYDSVKTCVVCPFHVATQLFKDKVRWNHRWLMTTLEPMYVANEIIKAIELGKEEVWLPPVITIMPLFRFLPTWMYDTIHSILGSNDSIVRD